MTPFEEDLALISQKLKALGINNKTFFVTGATGLVGSVFVKGILAGNQQFDLNNRVIAFVRNSKKAESIFNSNPLLTYCVGDITQSISFDGNIDFIVHAASETKSLNMVNYPVETLWTSLCGAKNVLDFAKDKNIEKMVFLSSMEAFGTGFDGKSRVSEDQLGYIALHSVRSCYPESKRMAENMCCCYASEYQVPVVIVRLAQTFGAGTPQNESRVFAQFARSALNGQNIILHTSGESYGNYVYTADVATAILTLLCKGIPPELYTVANEENTMSIRSMAQMVADRIASGAIKVTFEIPDNNQYGYAPDTKLKLDASKMRQLGWTPMFNLEEAYRRMISEWEITTSD